MYVCHTLAFGERYVNLSSVVAIPFHIAYLPDIRALSDISHRWNDTLYSPTNAQNGIHVALSLFSGQVFLTSVTVNLFLVLMDLYCSDVR